MLKGLFITLFLLFHFLAQSQERGNKLAWAYTLEESRLKYDSIYLDPNYEHYQEYDRVTTLLFEEYKLTSFKKKKYTVAYKRYYHPNGKIKSEGLWVHGAEAAWFYYDTLGLLYAGYNFDTKEYKEYSSSGKNFQWIFDLAEEKANALMLKYYDIKFVDEHLRITKVSWAMEGDRRNSGTWPELPFKTPSHIFVLFRLTFEENFTAPEFVVRFDKDLNLLPFTIDTIDYAKFYYAQVRVGYEEANKITKRKGLTDEPILSFDKETKLIAGSVGNFYWHTWTKKTLREAPDFLKTRVTYITINATTGKYEVKRETERMALMPLRYRMMYRFQRSEKKIIIKEGFKEVGYMKNIFVTVPNKWRVIRTTLEQGGEKASWLVNNNDTIEFKQVCGKNAEPMLGQQQDDKLIAARFDSLLNCKDLHQWKYSIGVKTVNQDSKITFCFYREGTTTYCGNEIFYLTLNRLNGCEDEYSDIIKSTRFFFYPPYKTHKKMFKRPHRHHRHRQNKLRGF